jgi:hypothetical protein
LTELLVFNPDKEIVMKSLNSLAFGLALFALASPVFAADSAGSISITAPANGAVLSSGSGDKLEFNVHLGPTGNHVHIYVDDQSPIIDRDIHNCPCSIDLPMLSPGKHTIAIKEATVSHALTGVEGTVTVTVQGSGSSAAKGSSSSTSGY